MKITDPKVIQSGEAAFLNAVKDHLDWHAIREIVKKQMEQWTLESKGGELVVHDNNVAFKMDVSCSLDMSILFDRMGNLVSHESLTLATAADSSSKSDTSPLFMADMDATEAGPESSRSSEFEDTVSQADAGPGGRPQDEPLHSDTEPSKSGAAPSDDDGEEGVLELDQLLEDDDGDTGGERSPDDDALMEDAEDVLELDELLSDEPTSVKEDPGESDDLDLEKLFFKEKEMEESSVDPLSDENGGFWEEEKD